MSLLSYLAKLMNQFAANKPVGEPGLIDKVSRYRSERNARERLDYSSMPLSDVDKHLCDLVSHTIEEIVEFKMCINRKSWKPLPSLRDNSPQALSLRTQALEELADVLLMLDAVRDAAGFSYEEVESALLAKIDKNLSRKDHVCNKPLD